MMREGGQHGYRNSSAAAAAAIPTTYELATVNGGDRMAGRSGRLAAEAVEGMEVVVAEPIPNSPEDLRRRRRRDDGRGRMHRSTSPKMRGGGRRRARSRTPTNQRASLQNLVQEPVYLMVAIERGRNLTLGGPVGGRSKSGSFSDASEMVPPAPYAVVEHAGEVMETGPVIGTAHPIWGAHFLFELSPNAADDVLIVVRDANGGGGGRGQQRGADGDRRSKGGASSSGGATLGCVRVDLSAYREWLDRAEKEQSGEARGARPKHRSSAVNAYKWTSLQPCSSEELSRAKIGKGGWLKGLWGGRGGGGGGGGGGAGGGGDDWDGKGTASNGKVLVSVASLRFGELPDLLASLPHLEDNTFKTEALTRRMARKLGVCMDAIRNANPSLHSHLVGSGADGAAKSAAAAAYGSGSGSRARRSERESSYFQQNPEGIDFADDEDGGGHRGGSSALVASTEEAAQLAEGVGTALDWYERHLNEETKLRESLEEQLRDAAHEAESQRRRADSLQRLHAISGSVSDALRSGSGGGGGGGGGGNGSGAGGGSGASRKRSSLLGLSSKFRSGSGGVGGSDEDGNWQEVLMDTHREIQSLHEDLERERATAAAAAVESEQKLRDSSKSSASTESALASAKEELKRQKETRTDFERQQTR